MKDKNVKETAKPWMDRNLLVNRCSKCGAGQEKIMAEYHPDKNLNPVDDDLLTNGTKCIVGEHLHCQCNRCGYTWISDPINRNEN